MMPSVTRSIMLESKCSDVGHLRCGFTVSEDTLSISSLSPHIRRHTVCDCARVLRVA